MSFLDTPFWEHGREPGRFLDCVGVVACGLEEIGVPWQDRPYALSSMHDHFDAMEAAFALTFDAVPLDAERQVGDVLSCRWPSMPNHAIVWLGGDVGLHAVPDRGTVLAPIDWSAQSRVRSVWRLPSRNKMTRMA